MEKLYPRQLIRWGLLMSWLLAGNLGGHAQSALLQWQQLVDDPSLSDSVSVRAVKAATGGYALLVGTRLVRYTPTGAVSWNQPVPGTYSDSLAARVPVRAGISLVATADGGFAVLGLDALRRYSVSKFDASGQAVWTKMLDDANTGPLVRLTDDVLAGTPDGNFWVAGSYQESLSYLTVTKLSKEGYILGQWRIKFAEATQATRPLIRKILPTSDGGSILLGGIAGASGIAAKGLAIKLDSRSNLVWQKEYDDVLEWQDGFVNPTDAGITVAGLSPRGNALLLKIGLDGTVDESLKSNLADSYGPVSLGGDGDGNLTLLSGTGDVSSDFRLTSLTAQGAVRWAKTYGGSGPDVPMSLLATDDGGYLLAGTTTSTDGDVQGKASTSRAGWVVKLGNSPAATSLRLLAPTYNCTTGAIVFQSTGGDGTPITYGAPGVTRTNGTDNFGTVEAGLRADPKVIPITATQNGQTVRYDFDLKAYCPVPEAATDSASKPPLELITPTYNCQTGAITFHTVGGDGTPIAYRAAGITDWTTNPSQFVDEGVRTAYDAQPFTLMARQSGKVVTYSFNLKAACGRARQGVEPGAEEFTVRVLGNPAREAVTIQISGTQGQALRMQLVDEQGRLVEQRAVEKTGALEQHTFDLRRQATGVLLLHTTANGQTHTVKVVKQ